MNDAMSKVLKLPRGLPTARHVPRPTVELPPGMNLEDVPLISKGDSPDKVIQEVWTARVRVFDLSDPQHVADLEKIWQRVCEGSAKVCETKTDFVQASGKYVTMLRWADIGYKLPEQ